MKTAEKTFFMTAWTPAEPLAEYALEHVLALLPAYDGLIVTQAMTIMAFIIMTVAMGYFRQEALQFINLKSLFLPHQQA